MLDDSLQMLVESIRNQEFSQELTIHDTLWGYLREEMAMDPLDVWGPLHTLRCSIWPRTVGAIGSHLRAEVGGALRFIGR